MTGDLLSGQDHVARYCKPKTLQEDGNPSGASFMLRRDEPYLSVNWMECFGRDKNTETQIDQVRRHIALRLSHNAKLAVLNVKDTADNVRIKSPDNRIIYISHQPTKKDPSHSGILGYEIEDELIADLIAEAVCSVHPAIVS